MAPLTSETCFSGQVLVTFHPTAAISKKDQPKDVPGHLLRLQQESCHGLEGSVQQESVGVQDQGEWSCVGLKQLQPYEKRAADIRLAYEEAMREYQAEEEESNEDGKLSS